MIENDNENKLAEKNGPVVENTFRFIPKNLRFKYRSEWNICIFYKNADIVKKSQISKENSMKAAWLEKLTKTRHQ